MKKFLVSVCFVTLGLTAGLTMPRPVAQSDAPAPVQKWEQFCEAVTPSASQRFEKDVKEWNASMKAHGEKGYKLAATVALTRQTALCYVRPAR